MANRRGRKKHRQAQRRSLADSNENYPEADNKTDNKSVVVGDSNNNKSATAPTSTAAAQGHPIKRRVSNSSDGFSKSPDQSSPPTQRAGAARGTRSARPTLVSAFEWEALEKKSGNVKPSPAVKKGAVRKRVVEKSEVPLPPLPVRALVPEVEKSEGEEEGGKKQNSPGMARNRPRGPPLPRDNGLAANEETDMWNRILQDLRKAKEKNDKQQALSDQIAVLNEKIARDGNRPTLSEHNQLDSLHRQMLKLCEDERAILQDEPSDVIKNLGLLMALRQASEAEAPLSRAASLPKSRKKRGEVDGSATDSPGPTAPPVPDRFSRIKGSAQRSSSASSAHARDGRDRGEGSNVIVKIEENPEFSRGALAERSGLLTVGAEVVYKNTRNNAEGEGIQCIIKSITGDGTKKRYDVQDPEPNEHGEQGTVFKTTAASLIPIPAVGTTLPSFPVGKLVLARYPDTTTFYRAEVMGSKKDVYRLKFEGEEDDKEMEVDKRFVLDIPGK